MKFTFKSIILSTALALSSVSYAQENDIIKGLNKKLFDPSVTYLVVGDEKISNSDFTAELFNKARNKFYHGKIQISDFKPLVESTKDFFIDKILVVNYGLNNKIEPNQEELQKRFADFKKKMGDQQWEKTKAHAEKAIRLAYVYELVEKNIKIVSLDEKNLQKYYKANKDKLFTEPEKFDISMILLSVSPSASQEVWDRTHKEALALTEKINSKKVTFNDVATLQSADSSNKQGGRVGLIHKGILPAEAEEMMSASAPNTILPPLFTNEGVSIIKFHGKKEPSASSFETVKPRLIALYTNEEKENVFNRFKKELRAKAKISVNPETEALFQNYVNMSK